MRKCLVGLLMAVTLAGCSTLALMADPPPGMVTAEVMKQVLNDKPDWVEPAQEIARAVMGQAGASPTLDDLQALAYKEIDVRYASPEIRAQGRLYVDRIRKGLETDLAALGAFTAVDRALKLAEFIAWISAV